MIKRLYWLISDWWSGKPLGGLRSPRWSEFRKIHIKKNCEACGAKGKLLQPLQLHHVIPFSQDKSKELDPENVITLCCYCHFVIAHLRNYKSWNKDIKEDAKKLIDKIIHRP